MARNGYNKMQPAAWRAALAAAALAACAGIALAGGASPVGMAAFYVCAAVYLVGPGCLFADWIGPREPALRPLLVMVYGCGFLAGLNCVAVRLGMVWLLRLLPPALTLAWLVWRRRLPAPRRALAWLGSGRGLLWAGLCLLSALMLGAVNPHPAQAGAVVLNQDMLWNVGNAAALSRNFPAQDIRFSGVRLSYHYLNELLSAALGLASGARLYDIYFFFAAPLFLLGELLTLDALAGVYFGPENPQARRWLTPLLFGAQCASVWTVFSNDGSLFGNTLLVHMATNVNAQATALVFLAAFTALFATVSRRGFAVGWRHGAALAAAFLLLCVAKGPEAAIVVCSFGITMVLVLLFQKPRYGRAVLCLVGIAAVFAVVYRFLYASGSNSMALSIFAMENTWAYRTLSPYADWLCAHLPVSGYVWLVGIGVIDAFCMAPLQFLLWLRGAPGALLRLPRLDPARIMANGIVVGGFLAYHLFYHTSSSQVYFALVAIIYLSLLAAEQVGPLLRGGRAGKVLCAVAGAVGVATTACMVALYTGQGLQGLAATVGLAPATANASRVTACDEQAMAWLAENSSPGLVFATNRTTTAPGRDTAISNAYSAFSARQAYMEGWTYAETNMGVDWSVIEGKRAVNNLLFDPATDEETLREICRQEGIGCLVYARAWPGTPPAFLQPAYENADVAIYWID